MDISQIVRIAVMSLGGALVIATPLPVRAQGAVEPQILRIRKQYEAIDSPMRHYTVRKHERTYENSNDAYTGYYDGKELCKLVVVSSGERDQSTTKFYLSGGHIFFIHRIITQFNSLADNKGVSFEQRFYFDKDRLIRWLGKDNVAKPVDTAEARTVANTFFAVRREAVAVLKPKPSP